jgi:hypothetical protein
MVFTNADHCHNVGNAERHRSLSCLSSRRTLTRCWQAGSYAADVVQWQRGHPAQRTPCDMALCQRRISGVTQSRQAGLAYVASHKRLSINRIREEGISQRYRYSTDVQDINADGQDINADGQDQLPCWKVSLVTATRITTTRVSDGGGVQACPERWRPVNTP